MASIDRHLLVRQYHNVASIRRGSLWYQLSRCPSWSRSERTTTNLKIATPPSTVSRLYGINANDTDILQIVMSPVRRHLMSYEQSAMNVCISSYKAPTVAC